MQDYANETYGAYGCNDSICKAADSKPLIIFVQDKLIFNQFLFGSK